MNTTPRQTHRRARSDCSHPACRRRLFRRSRSPPPGCTPPGWKLGAHLRRPRRRAAPTARVRRRLSFETGTFTRNASSCRCLRPNPTGERARDESERQGQGGASVLDTRSGNASRVLRTQHLSGAHAHGGVCMCGVRTYLPGVYGILTTDERTRTVRSAASRARVPTDRLRSSTSSGVVRVCVRSADGASIARAARACFVSRQSRHFACGFWVSRST